MKARKIMIVQISQKLFTNNVTRLRYVLIC